MRFSARSAAPRGVRTAASIALLAIPGDRPADAIPGDTPADKLAFPALPADAPVGSGITAPCHARGLLGTARCGVFRVSEDREGENTPSRTLDLAFVVLHALEPDQRAKDAVLQLPGGPGGPDAALTALAIARSQQLPAAVRRHRDVILADVRGVGRSGGLSCGVPYPRGLASRFETLFPLDHAAACRDALDRDAQLDRYTTAATVDDLEELRRWLGYSSVNLFGASYGTRVAQVYMRRHPAAVRTAVLNGVAPVAEPLYVQHAFLLQRALDRLLAECRAETACHSTYPDLDDRLHRLLSQFRERSADVEVGGTRVSFGAAALSYSLRGLLYARGRELLGLIHRAADGDIAPLVEFYVTRTDGFGAPNGNAGYHFSVLCAEDIAPLTDEVVERATRGTYMGDHFIEAYRSLCRIWPHAKLAPSHWTPVQSDVPTLLLSGGRDPVTPPEGAEAVAAHLSRSLHVVVPNGGHGVGGPCIERMISQLVASGTLAGLDSSCGETAVRPTPLQQEMHPAIGTAGVVSSAHPLATEAGRDILASGGNAFDAAVAVAAALGVVEPMMSGIGGYGTIMLYDAANRRARFLNSSGRIPRSVDSDAYRAPTPDYMQNRRGAKAVSTPGNVNAWEALWRGNGRLAWSRLFDNAVQLAEEGFDISELSATRIADAFDEFPAHARSFYGVNGRPLRAGERLVQRDLGHSLRLIAREGAAAFHGGQLGLAVDSAMRAAGGFLTLDDLRENEAEWWDPISISYRGHEIVTASPPANAFDALVRLGIMSQFDVRSLGHNTLAYLHRFAEATKHGYWVRLRWAGDPDARPPPVGDLLAERYWADQAATMDTLRASVFAPPTSFASGDGQSDGHTTHFVIADRWGNVVSATQTLGNLFGARIMPEGTGIWLNNSLAYSTFEPKGNPMDAHAGRRKLSGDVPVLVMRDGRVWAALGTPGGHSIGQTVPQMLMNLIDFDMNIKEALTAPRISFIEPDVLAVEEGIRTRTREALAAMGHQLRVVRALGNAHGLTIEYGTDGQPLRFRGAADPRGEGMARGIAPNDGESRDLQQQVPRFSGAR